MKLAYAGLAAASTALSPVVDHYTQPLLGATLNVLVAALIGCACGFATKGEGERLRLLRSLLTFPCIAAACVTLLPWWFGKELIPEVRAPLAIVLGFAARFLIPLATSGELLSALQSWAAGWLSKKGAS